LGLDVPVRLRDRVPYGDAPSPAATAAAKAESLAVAAAVSELAEFDFVMGCDPLELAEVSWSPMLA
jgi:hypothetical protein